MSRAERLPRADTEETFDAVVRDESALRPGVDALCRALDVDRAALQRLPNGSLPVYATGELVLKLFPPVHVAAAAVESGVLRVVAGHLPVPTPGVHADGVHDGWSYVLMDRLPGVDLSTVWSGLPRADRCRLAGEAGALTAALHRVAPPVAADWWPQGWGSFVDDQRTTAVDRHRRWGLPEPWLVQVDDLLDAVDASTGPEVLLHTEVMPANLLAARDDGGRWALSGLCDFEPALRGSAEYDLVAVAVFMGGGDPAVLREALLAHGLRADQLDHGLSRRLLAWTFLHRFGDVASFFDLLPPPPAPTVDALAESWFGLAGEPVD